MLIVWKRKHIRNSRPELFGIRGVFKILRKTLCRSHFLRKLEALRPAFILKRDSETGVLLWFLRNFCVNFFLQNSFNGCFRKHILITSESESWLIRIYVLTKFACFQVNMNLIISNKRIHLQIFFQTVGLYWEARSYCNDFWVKLARGKVIFNWKRKGAMCRKKRFPLFYQLNTIIEIAVFFPWPFSSFSSLIFPLLYHLLILR